MPEPLPSSHDRILQAAKSLFASRGYESTSTVAIARAAGTSESQLMKHFGSKEGILEAIFESAWLALNPRLRLAAQAEASPADKLQILAEQVLSAFERDAELRLLLLLEGRRIRKEGHMIMLSRGFREFVQMVDDVLGEMRATGQLQRNAHLQAVRSALMGALEGLLRDQLLQRQQSFPADYGPADVRHAFQIVLTAFRANPRTRRRQR